MRMLNAKSMMARRLCVLVGLLPSVAAAPAVIWTNQNQKQSQQTIHSSRALHAKEILSSALGSTSAASSSPDSSNRLSSVVFLLSRSEDGSESLSKLASQGDLPLIANEYETAHTILHNVHNLDSSHTLASDISRQGHVVLDVTLEELTKKLSLLEESDEAQVETTGSVSAPAAVSKSEGKRARALAKANVLIVKLDVASTKPADMDRAVVQAIHHAKIDTVVLAGIRSIDEVKQERSMYYQRRLALMPTVERVWSYSSSRRLEDQGQNNGNNNNQDMSGVYYVSMTPNILAGLLFTALFGFVTMVAVSCMGMIAGQDTYVKVYPSIGREA